MLVSLLLFFILVFGVIAKNQEIWVLVSDPEQVTSLCWASVSPSVMKQVNYVVYTFNHGILCRSQTCQNQGSTTWSGKCCDGGSQSTVEENLT